MGVGEVTQFLAPLAQFGAAGLIAAMWLVERRAASAREGQLGEAHARLMEQREQLAALIEVVTDNTRAMTALEGTQRTLASMVGEMQARDAA
ncbi:MAG: hypothetical protein Tsb0013_16810 [Phycisphaerales bacterium]